MKKVFNETFTHLDDALYYFETTVFENRDLHIHEAKLHHVNGQWNVGLLFDEAQMRLDIDE